MRKKKITNNAVQYCANLSLNQKCKMLYGDGDWQVRGFQNTPLKSLVMHDGPAGLRIPRKALADTTSLLPQADPATCFPLPCLTACSWDPELLALMGSAMGKECRAANTDILLSPGVNIKRNPLCGRNFEYFSEDPLLSGKLAAGFINGLQKEGVGACIKHYAVNNQEFRRFTYSAEVDERALFDIYLRPFEIAIEESDPWCLMAAYNRINGVYCSENAFLLKDVLRKRFKYDGVVMSDWGAVSDVVACHANGLDIEMPGVTKSRWRAIHKGVKKGRISLDDLNASVERIAALSDKVASRDPAPEHYDYEESHAIARKVAEESIVLLKNKGNLLPIKEVDDICLIGTLAKTPHYQGQGSSEVNSRHLVSLYDAFKENGREVDYAPGYDFVQGVDETSMIIEAADMASRHSKAIVVVGLPNYHDSEGYDRAEMKLPQNQNALIDAIRDANKNVIVIIQTGAPVELPWVEHVPAILLAYLSGEAGGEALRNILLGFKNPCGHLAESWPVRYQDVPSSDFYPGSKNISTYKESIFVGYRFYTTTGRAPLFAFGHGLAYSNFTYSKITISETQFSGGKLSIKAVVYNDSDITGTAVPQLYVRKPSINRFHPKRELLDFKKITLKPFEAKTVEFIVPYSALGDYEPDLEKRVVDPGDYYFEIGASSEDIKLKTSCSVSSPYTVAKSRRKLPNYFNLKSPLRVSDEEFTKLLQHQFTRLHDTRKRPFTIESTVDDMERTFIGSNVEKALIKRMNNPNIDEVYNQKSLDSLLFAPIRFVSMAIPEPVILAFVDLANRKPLRALMSIILQRKRK
ncbi:MAG: glycoside hydrolase family 3 C-terminal domain-containing protein [Bacilli bacterium]|nr:glycoside hydrolase family 3 C-terminal domain-containing protein [Bacilli bacterium]